MCCGSPLILRTLSAARVATLRTRVTNVARRFRRFELGAALIVAIALLVWPYLTDPGTIFYVRYFDTDTLFNPWWSLHRVFQAWNDYIHLGYASEINLSYLSVPLVAGAVFSFVGPVAMSRLSPALMIVFSFAAMYAYVVSEHRDVPRRTAVLVAFFYASNPYVMTLVHDGYAGILAYYALFPLTLMLVDMAERFERPVLVALVPVAYTLVSYFTYPAVAINLLALVALRHRALYRMLRGSVAARVAVIGSALVNAYWIVPLIVNLKLHTFIPILSESSGDIARISTFATLSNALLLRSYSEIWTSYAVPECTACSWFLTPGYVAGILFIVALGARRLWEAWRVLACVTAAAIVLATGFHYQDDIIGIPYQWLMSLPVFGLFRGANLFISVVAFGYSLGLVAALRTADSRRRFEAVAALAVILVSLPMIDGAYIERARSASTNVKAFPNFPVTIPRAYADLKRHLDVETKSDVTLLLPAMPFANYAWGAYGNDFLMPYLDRPTLSQFLWPQPNLALQQKLDVLTSLGATRDDTTALMRVMRVGRIVTHDDVNGTVAVQRSRFGTTTWREDALAEVVPDRRPLPLFQAYDRIAHVRGSLGIEQYAALFGRPATPRDDSAASQGCPTQAPVAITAFAPATLVDGRATVDFDPALTCEGIFPFEIVYRSRERPTPSLSVVRGSGSRTVERLRFKRVPSGLQIANANVRIGPGDTVRIVQASVRDRPLVAVFGESLGLYPASDEAIVAPAMVAGAFARIAVPDNTGVIAVNRSNDPVWLAFDVSDGRAHVIEQLLSNGYATAYVVTPGSVLYIVNLAQLAIFAGALLTIVGIVILARTLAVRTERITPVMKT